MQPILDEQDVEAIARRFGKHSQVALLCQSHEALRRLLEEYEAKDEQRRDRRIDVGSEARSS